MSDSMELVLQEFMKLSAIPRPSHHEEQVGAYLCHWAATHGLQVEQDEWGQVVIEKPAYPGCEKAPRVILQAHMDMVCAAEEGVSYDPLHDPIRVHNDGITLTAEGTTLGADDGIGMAIALYVLQNKKLRHGPLRVIFTTCEEDGMSAQYINPKYCNADYLINLDWETTGALCHSCASASNYHFRRRTDWESAPAGTRLMTLSLEGLRGGHSAIDIHRGHPNPIVSLAQVMALLRQGGISYRIAAFHGGHAANAIPEGARITFSVAEAQLDMAKAIVDSFAAEFCETYAAAEPGYSFEVSVADLLSTPVLNRETGYHLIDLITLLPCGVRDLGKTGRVKASGNIGLIDIDEKEIRLSNLLRSNKSHFATLLQQACRTAAERCHFACICATRTPGWKENPDNPLVCLACRAYAKLTGKEMVTESVHAAVECGVFARKNPALDMISIGPTIRNAHTPSESCDLADIRIATELLETILQDAV